MDRPTNVQQYIKLTVPQELSKEEIKGWYHCVRKNAPNGIVSSLQMTDDSGARKNVYVLHKESKQGNAYIVPLSRDVSDREVKAIVDAYVGENPDMDLDIEASSSEADSAFHKKDLDLSDDKYENLCTAWAKKQHEDWMHDREKDGWRYGPTVSMKNKTHPLLRQWHELPDKFRKVDTEQPQTLLDLLNDQGYAVIGKGELEGILKLLKGGL